MHVFHNIDTDTDIYAYYVCLPASVCVDRCRYVGL